MSRWAEEPRLKKSLGQNFLKFDWPVQRVVERLQSWNVTRVLEIGPGGGILTKALLEAGMKVTAVERDDRFVERLRDFERERGDQALGELEIVANDVLKVDLAAWIAASREASAVVGNIPYNISSPIVMWILPHLAQLRGAVLMVQLEFAQRLSAAVDTKAYGSLSVYTQLRSMVDFECKVDRNCFRPAPKVDSAIVSLKPRTPPASDEVLKEVELLTRAAFNQRRKKLSNALRNIASDEELNGSPIDLTRRAETLRPEEFVELARFVFRHR